MIHNMKLNAGPFYAIKAGYKTIELRLNDKKRQQIEIGDSISFRLIDNPNETLTKKVTALHKFSDFEELYKNLPLLKCGYTPFTLPEATPEEMEEYYPKEKQKKYNVLGIELEEFPLQKYLAGQTGAMPSCSSYEQALKEIRSGKKETHWIWYIFPQLKGLTHDPVTEYYALNGKHEAREYFEHPILGKRLLEITNELLDLDTSDPVVVFGIIDAFKLRSCMTLFTEIAPEQAVFRDVLDKFCLGMKDEKTLRLL